MLGKQHQLQLFTVYFLIFFCDKCHMSRQITRCKAIAASHRLPQYQLQDLCQPINLFSPRLGLRPLNYSAIHNVGTPLRRSSVKPWYHSSLVSPFVPKLALARLVPNLTLTFYSKNLFYRKHPTFLIPINLQSKFTSSKKH